MRDVSIIGIGQTPVLENWTKSLRHLAADAVLAAMRDAGIDRADMLFVGNMLSGEITGQAHLGALVADFVGLRGIEAFKIEAACASGAAAVRVGYLAVAGGMADVVIAVGVEKMTDESGEVVTAGLALAADGDYEVPHGLSFVAINALLMQRYMYEYGIAREDFANFAINSHRNAVGNPNARFHNPITFEQFINASTICAPIGLLDSSPIGDGAAAVILCPTEQARAFSHRSIRIVGSGVATDCVSLHDRKNPLRLIAAEQSVHKAYRQAGIGPQDIDFFEYHDAFTIMAALSLEASGFAAPGQGTRLAKEGDIFIDGRIPAATMGGLKGRGHPVGATGAYQIVEAAQQLRGECGPNQLPAPRFGMAQNIGGSGATIITHILRAEE
ncbi:MAG: thiolase domain-containing protein [Anaerolineae bacterium]|nr:thiolase domain-containing protein [Anaerolineae bacterium]